MKEIKLSVIIPVYNVEKYVRDCVESLYRQGLNEEEFEVILINDGSTDGSLSILRKLEEVHRNIRVMEQANQGPSVARNQGILAARGEYIHFVDSDDIVLDSSLPLMLDTAIRYKLDILKGDYLKANDQEIEKGITRKTPSDISYTLKNGEQGFIEDNDPMYCYIWMHLFKRKFLVENKLHFMDLGCFEDTVFITHTYLKSARFMAIPYPFYVYRRHETSIMSTMSLRKLYCMNEAIRYIQELAGELHLTPAGNRKIRYNLFASLTVSLWYLSHHRSLYPHRMEIINDLKKKVPGLRFSDTLRQKLVIWCYRYIPNLYISVRYITAKKKYN